MIPPGGGRLTLPSGDVAIAESVGPAEEAYLVRAAAARRARPDARPLVKLALLGRDRALLDVDGRRTELRPRLAEILALLCARPEGMSAGTLCADLHGDAGSPSSVRVEVSRLRKLLGPWIDTDRYRLTCDVETDVRRVEGLLRAGDVREAAEAYPGPLLPDSEAPGVVEAREQLDAWLRQAVMTSGDPDALWAWVNAPRPRRHRRVEAPARDTRVPRPAAQPLRGAGGRAAPRTGVAPHAGHVMRPRRSALAQARRGGLTDGAVRREIVAGLLGATRSRVRRLPPIRRQTSNPWREHARFAARPRLASPR